MDHFVFSLALRYTQQTVAEKPTKRTQEPNKWKPETWHIGKQAVYGHVTKRASGVIFDHQGAERGIMTNRAPLGLSSYPRF